MKKKNDRNELTWENLQLTLEEQEAVKQVKGRVYPGYRFGSVVVVGRMPGATGAWFTIPWLTRCDCGNYREISWGRLASGYNFSCGCKQRPKIEARIAAAHEAMKRHEDWVKEHVTDRQALYSQVAKELGS